MDAGECLEGKKNGIPIFSTLEQANEKLSSVPDYFTYEIAPSEAFLKTEERTVILQAMTDGMHIVNALHEFLTEDEEFKKLMIKTMREAGIETPLLLLQTPALSEIDGVIQYADISMNTEIKTIEKLSIATHNAGIRHKIILMIEMDDLREGIMPECLTEFVKQVLSFNKLQDVTTNSIEIMTHPAIVDEDLRAVSSYQNKREEELAILCSLEIPDWVENLK